jgi:hypothetical protein
LKKEGALQGHFLEKSICQKTEDKKMSTSELNPSPTASPFLALSAKNLTTCFGKNLFKYFFIHILVLEKMCADDVVCSSQCHLLNWTAYFGKNLKKHCSDG